MAKFTQDIDFFGNTVITQASDRELDRIYNRVVNNVFEFQTRGETNGQAEKILTWSSAFRLKNLKNYLFTNAHAVLALLEISYIQDPGSGEYISQSIKGNKARGTRLRLLDRQLDLAGLIFTENSSFAGNGLNFAQEDISIGQPCYVVAVPESINNKRIVGGKIKGVYDNCFTYSCDTENGSSGSPILNTAGEVIGQHRGLIHSDQGVNYALGTKANSLDSVLSGDLSAVSINQLDKNQMLAYAAGGLFGLSLLSK